MAPADTLYVLPLADLAGDSLREAVRLLGERFRLVDRLDEAAPAADLVVAIGRGAPDEPLARVRELEGKEGWRYLGLLLWDAGAGLDPALAADPSFLDALPPDAPAHAVAWALARCRRLLEARREVDRLTTRVNLQGREMQELNRIGVALSAERDPQALLDLILVKSREITSADAGSLYLVEPRPGAEEVPGDFLADKQMRFCLAQNDSVRVPFQEFVMEIDRRSVAGHVALSGEVVNLADAYQPPAGSPFVMNRAFDEQTGYRTRSMLVVPMRNHRDEPIGVLQLINRKRSFAARLGGSADVDREVVPFDDACRDLVTSLASQAAVSLENTRLYEEIRRLFEGFIRASVIAIESRDPTTSGHSERVAALTVGLAEAVDRTDEPSLRRVHFTRDDLQELRFASLLHDFGKIGVREPVLVKEKKLFAHELEAIRRRFQLIRRGIELQHSRRKLQDLLDQDRDEAVRRFPQRDRERSEALRQLDDCLDLIVRANDPTVLEAAGFEALLEIGRLSFLDDAGEETPYLTADEVARLSITRGSLSEAERREIESHVTHTYRFLMQIPWSRDLRSVPQIAYAHHEKLDGTGYPRRLREPAIPIQSRMMTVSDIYDALTASDRPYKKSLPTRRALDILAAEVKQGKLDAALFRIFVDAKIFTRGRVVPGA